jgi:hypothetical protein
MLSTIDNPFNPFEQFESWFMFDIEKGYNSCSRLARVAQIADNFTPIEADIEVERAIDSIIDNDFTGTYIKVRCKPATVDSNDNT